MYLYTNEGKRKRFVPIEELGSGVQGTVYKISDKVCLKRYKTSENNNKILKTLKKEDLSNINKIYDFYYDQKGNFKAYTREYQEEDKIDILTMPTSYTLENLYALYDSISRLSELNILASDLHTGNIIINEKGIVIIDTDEFSKSMFFDEGKVYKKNLNAIIYLFKEIYKEALISYHDSEDYLKYCYYIPNLFNREEDNPIEEATKKLIKHKYPIDYLKAQSR